MKPSFKHAMRVAAQLTAGGGLQAATAAIQKALAGEAAVPSTLKATWSGTPRSVRRAGTSPGETDIIDVQGRWVDDLPSESEAGNEAGSTLAGTFGNAAGSRDYLLYLPPAIGKSAQAPALVIMLHGCTQTPADFAAGTAMNALADRHGFAVLYPGQSQAANQSACWNWFNPADQRAEAGEPSIIVGMAREVIAGHGIDSRRIFVAGLSAGGAMAAILADTYPDLVAAVAVHSGLPSGAAHDLPSALAAMKRGGAARTTAKRKAMRTIVFHGRQDRTVHPANGAQIAAAALAAWPPRALSVRHETDRSPGGRSYTRTIHADAGGRPMVEVWDVQGAGHAWSGGSALGSYTDPKGPDASAAMIDFFLAHRN